MTTLINGRTPEQLAAWNRWHGIVAILLAILLLLLWLAGRGPGHAAAGGSCCGVAAPVAEAPTTPALPAAPVDTDGDGVPDTEDYCPGTPAATPVDEFGCDLVDSAGRPRVRVYFDVDSYYLREDAVERLAPVLRYLRENASAVAVVSGYHDPTGGMEHNVELARNRAFAVRDFMVKEGVEEARLAMVKPVDTTGEGPHREARHVDISIRP